jgi:hypothetical protein
VDEAGSGHRLDDGADGLSVDLLDSPRQGPQAVDVGRDGELVEMPPSPESRQTSTFFRLRSNPAHNM